MKLRDKKKKTYFGSCSVIISCSTFILGKSKDLLCLGKLEELYTVTEYI